MNKSFCANDASDIKIFDPELGKIAEIYRNLVKCSFKSGTFPVWKKLVLARSKLKKDAAPDYLNSCPLL